MLRRDCTHAVDADAFPSSAATQSWVAMDAPRPPSRSGHDDLEESGVLNGVHHLGHHSALGLGPVGMLGKERAECGGPGNASRCQLRHRQTTRS